MKGKFMIIAALLGALTFGACVDNNESDSVVNVRNAKAEELKSIAALNNAKAQAELIAANADAALKASQAAINEADAAIKEAQARYHEALAEAEEIQNEQDRALLEAKIAEYEAEIAKWQMMKAQYVAQMERDAIVAEKALLQAQIELLNKEQKFNEKLAEIEAAEALVLKQLYQQYASEARNLNVSIGKVNEAKNAIAEAEAGIIDAEEAAAKSIARYEEQIAADEAQIAKLNEFLAVIVEEHGDEILTDAEVKELYEKTYVEYLKALEAYEVAVAAQTAANDVLADAKTACSDIKSTSKKDGLGTALKAAREAYFAVAEEFVEQGGLLKLEDDASAATGNSEATSYGFYTTDKLTGVNSVYNEVIAIAAQPALNKDKEDDVLDGTYEYELWTINEKNLEAYVTALKGNKATADQIANLEKAVKDAQANYDKAVAAVEPAEKAAETAKAAYVKAADAKIAAVAAVKAWEDAMAAVVTNIDEAIEGLEDDYNDAVDARIAANDALKVAEAAWMAAGSPAKGALYDAKESAKIDFDIAQSLENKALSEMNLAKSNRALNIKLGQANLGDGKKEKAAVDAADKALAAAYNAYKLALKALGQAPQYTADGSWDIKAKYLTGDFEYAYDATKKVYYINYAYTNYADKAAYLADKVFTYVDAKGKTQKVVAAHVDVVDMADKLAKAEKLLAEAKDGNAEFVENVDKLIADLKEKAAAFEAAAKAYNEAWAAAVAVVDEAQAAYDEAAEVASDAKETLDAVDDVLDAIGIQHTECAKIYENLTKAIAYLEAQIERWKAAIEAIEADTETFEATIATNKAELEILEVEVEVQTIYVENAKAALDAALAEYAGSDETVTE